MTAMVVRPLPHTPHVSTNVSSTRTSGSNPPTPAFVPKPQAHSTGSTPPVPGPSTQPWTQERAVGPTKRVRTAARKLSANEMTAVGYLLAPTQRVEQYLIANLGELRRAALKEQAIRVHQGLPPKGPYAQAHAMLLGLLPHLEAHRETLEELHTRPVRGQ